MNEKLDYSKLNTIELKAISINYENLLNQTDHSPYPYFSITLSCLSDRFIDYPAEMIGGLKIFYDELSVICHHLLELAPTPPTLDPNELKKLMTNDELIDVMLKTGIINALVRDFQAIQNIIEIRLAMIERSTNTGALL